MQLLFYIIFCLKCLYILSFKLLKIIFYFLKKKMRNEYVYIFINDNFSSLKYFLKKNIKKNKENKY